MMAILLGTGSAAVALRALIYLAWTQKEDGGFDQNFWIDGEPHWRRIQLDETAFPNILAWRLHQAQTLQNFDPYPVVLKAAGYADIRVSPDQRAPICFTFFWTTAGHWEGRDFEVCVRAAGEAGP
jgi:hypothetical protein